MQKMKEGAVRNDGRQDSEKPRLLSHPVYGVRTDIPPAVVCALSEGEVSLEWTPAEGIVCLATANRGRYTSPTAQKTRLPLCVLYGQIKAKVRLLSAHKVYECAPLPYWKNVGVAYG